MVNQLLTGEQLVARFRKIRISRGLSARDLADMTGIHRSVLTNLENGRREKLLSIDEARIIADALDLDLLTCLRSEPITVTPAVTA